MTSLLSRNLGVRVRVNEVKGIREDRVSGLLGGDEDLALAGRVSKETIDFLTHQIYQIEGVVEKRVRLKEAYRIF